MPLRLVKLVALLLLTALVVAGEASAQVTLGDDAPLRFGRFEADGKSVTACCRRAGCMRSIAASSIPPPR